MRKIKSCLLLFSALVLPLHAYAASFNCSKAGTAVEKAICADPELSDLDERLGASYKKALSTAANESELRTAQKDWLKNVRNKCSGAACLKQAYAARVSELNEVTTTSPKLLSVAGHYTRYDEGQPDKHPSNITVRALTEGRVQVQGEALWVGNAETGNVNTGDMQGTFVLDGNKINYTDGEDEGCRLTITFTKNDLTVTDDNMRCGGLNVTFNGRYRKVEKAR